LTITGGTDAVLGTGTTIQVKQAGSSQSGFLSSTDWTTFNSKQNTLTNPVTGTGASGQVAFWNGTSSQTGDSGLVWNNANKRLLLNGSTATTNLGLIGSFALQDASTIFQNGFIQIRQNATNLIDAGMVLETIKNGVANVRLDLGIDSIIFRTNSVGTLSTEKARIFATGNLLLQNGGTFTDAGFRLDVNGTARVQGVLTTTADAVVNGVNIGRGGGANVNNTRVGELALNANTTGASNNAFGVSALRFLTTGSNNSAFGISSLRNITTTSSNVAIGADSGRRIADASNLTLSSNSLFIGIDTRAAADNQTNQIVIGHTAIGLGSNTTVIGNSSTTFGRWFGNLLVGSSTNSGQMLQVTGTSLFTGTATFSVDAVVNGVNIGRGGGDSSTSTVLGRSALSANTTGIDNTAIGSLSLTNITSGNNNVAFGRSSGRFIADNTTFNTISNNSVFLGWRTKPLADNQTNQIVIGYDSTGLGSNTTVIGNATTTHGRWYGSLLLGTTTNAASSILTMESTTQGFLPPRMTTTQKNAIASPATGLVVYDTTLNKLCVRGALTWETITSL
jgi:hypothetical protein